LVRHPPAAAAGGPPDVPRPLRLMGQPRRRAPLRTDHPAAARRAGVRHRPRNRTAAAFAARPAGPGLLGDARLRLRPALAGRLGGAFPRRGGPSLRGRGALRLGGRWSGGGDEGGKVPRAATVSDSAADLRALFTSERADSVWRGTTQRL